MVNDHKKWKVSCKGYFKKWYKIPEYQRHYLWKKEEVTALLDDIANRYDSDMEYFLGTIIFQRRVH